MVNLAFPMLLLVMFFRESLTVGGVRSTSPVGPSRAVVVTRLVQSRRLEVDRSSTANSLSLNHALNHGLVQHNKDRRGLVTLHR